MYDNVDMTSLQYLKRIESKELGEEYERYTISNTWILMSRNL
jgi:hypothetical protein